MIFFKKKKPSEVHYVKELYPMGVYTFAIACSHCKNVRSEKCHDCKFEIKSGFELKEVDYAKQND